MGLDKELLKFLVCPVDKGELEVVDSGNKLRCKKCSRKYPVRDGIPVMLPEEAEEATDGDKPAADDSDSDSDADSDSESDGKKKSLPADGNKFSFDASDSDSGGKKKSQPESVQEHKAEKEEPVSFGKHPLFERKKKRSDHLHGARHSKHNPYLSILEQHQQNKLRIAKISAVVFAIMIFAGIVYMSFVKWQRESRKNAKLHKVEKRLEELDRLIKSSNGYAKYKKALEAALWVDAGARIDNPKNLRKWQKIKLKYFAILTKAKPRERENFVNPGALLDMVYIPPGRFNIGRRESEKGEADERPWHPVVIPDGFWISRTEVSVSQFRMLFPKYYCRPWNNYKLAKYSQPVVRVDWHQAMEFCRILTRWARKDGQLPFDYEYRLPTEAEWEYACRAGTDSTYFWGDKFGRTGAKFANSLDRYTAKLFDWTKHLDMSDMAPNDGYRVSAPVGHYEPNAFGLYDMAGNVWEWCYDWYNPKAYRELPDTAPIQDQPVVNRIKKYKPFDAGIYYIEATSKVIRGGSWGNVPFDLRCSNRDNAVPEDAKNTPLRKLQVDHGNTGIGFRVVLAKKVSILVKEQNKRKKEAEKYK